MAQALDGGIGGKLAGTDVFEDAGEGGGVHGEDIVEDVGRRGQKSEVRLQK
jgi:hypothetical protein